MSIIEQIRAEVERLKKDKPYGEIPEHYYLKGLDNLLSFLDTLQEQPQKELLSFDGFVDKVGSWFANLELRRFRKTFDGEIFPATELVQAYEWFVHELSEKYREKHSKEQPVCEGLEEEYQQFCKDFPFPWSSQYINREYIDELCLGVARHFAQWQKEKDNEVADKALTMSIKLQEGWYAKGIADGEKSMKEQMMKNAVEGEVIDDGEVVVPALRTILSKMDDGDKVRIVIVKED